MTLSTDQRAPEVVCAGLLVADLFVPPLQRLPAAGELVATDDFLADSGGCAANAATSLTKLGVTSVVCGKVGNDSFGDFVDADLRAKGVLTSGVRRSSTHGTSKTVILPVVGQDRRYIHTFGANADFRAGDVDRGLLQHARIVYVGGYLALPALLQTDLAQLFELAHSLGALTVLDVVVPAGAPDALLDALDTVLPLTDYFIPNDEEAHALTGESEPDRQAERFLRGGCATAIITLGARGTVLVDRQQRIEAPVFAVDVVDASGSGDAFAAGLMVGLLEGWAMDRTLRFASAIGASACTRLGCTPGVFTRAQADAFLEANPIGATTE